MSGRSVDPDELLNAARAGERPALARLLSIVERGTDASRAVGAITHPLGGSARIIGITGAPGSGKSTLTNTLCAEIRSQDLRVAVLAIDPSSPFSGGAILGDRVRMTDLTLDEGVFVRSMATRGHLGGLTTATPAAVRVLDAVGFDVVIIETVGVGQVEVEIAGTADTVVVVVNPGWGDAVQANKAGLLEIADVFVINKADRDGVRDTRRDLEHMLDLSAPGDWRPPVIETVASDGRGIDDLRVAVDEHRAHLGEDGRLAARRADRSAVEMRRIVAERLDQRAGRICAGAAFSALHLDVLERRLDPWTAADRLLDGS
jgi:LAO/AO transport system kinase